MAAGDGADGRASVARQAPAHRRQRPFPSTSAAEAAGCTLSVYADDGTLSGDTSPEQAVWEIKKVLRKYSHRHSAGKECCKQDRPVEITSVIVTPNGLQAPNRQHKKLFEVRHEVRQARSDEDRAALVARVRGREAQMDQITSGNSGR